MRWRFSFSPQLLLYPHEDCAVRMYAVRVEEMDEAVAASQAIESNAGPVRLISCTLSLSRGNSRRTKQQAHPWRNLHRP